MSTIDATLPSPVTTASRWRLVGLMLAMVGAAHFNRISISVAGAGAIIESEGISETQMGFVYSAYLLFYTLAMSPGGWFIDHCGARLALFVVGAGSAIFVTLTGFAGLAWTGASLWLGLLVIRSLMGIVNAPTHPGSARLVGDWIPPGQRSFVNGATNFAACVGMSTTYLLFGFLMDRYGWTGASLMAAGATAILAIAWITFASSTPAPPVHALPSPAPNDSVLALLGNRSLLFLTLSYGALGYFQYLFFYWAEYYFKEVRHVSPGDSRLYTSILTLAMGLGMLAGGGLTDWMRSRWAHRYAVALVPVAGLVASALLLVPGALAESALTALVCFGVAMAAAGASEGAFWTLAVEIGGTRGGLAAGILNTGGNAGGLIAPVLTPIVSAYLGWQAGLGLASVVCLLGAAFWIFINPADRVATR